MLKSDKEGLWERVLGRLEERVGRSSFELWFKPIKLIELKEEIAILEVPNRFFKEWIEENYLSHIVESFSEVAAFSGQFKFRIADKDRDCLL